MFKKQKNNLQIMESQEKWTLFKIEFNIYFKLVTKELGLH